MSTISMVTILFCDLVESTERLVSSGDDAGDDFRHEFFSRLRDPVDANDGIEIKNLGDGLMVVFERSSLAALRCAEAMHRNVDSLDSDRPVQLRIGISAGEASTEDGDWFGTPVVEAARLCASADPTQTLASGVVRSLVGSRDAHAEFISLGKRRLKGLGNDVEVFAVNPVEAAAASPGPTATAPVPTRTSRGRRGRSALVAGVALLLAVAVLTAVLWAGGAAENDESAAEPVADNPTRELQRSEPHGYLPAFEQTDCPSDTVTAMPEATCGQLTVPEVRSRPDGRSILLDVVHGPARGEASADPVILLDVNEPLPSTPLRDAADVYSLSIRGVGPSSDPPMTCPRLAAATSAALSERADDVSSIGGRADAAKACAARLRAEGVDLDGYNLVEMGDDVRDLAIALELDAVSVAAGGLTTTAAVRFATTNPGAVTSLLLTNPSPPGRSTFADPALYLSKSFDHLIDLCTQDAECEKTHPDMKAAYGRLHSDAAASPRPVTVALPELGSAPATVLLDGRRIAAALAAGLRSSQLLGRMPNALGENGTRPELLATASINSDLILYLGESTPSAAFLSLICSNDAVLNQQSAMSAGALERYAGANDLSLQSVCAAWAVPSVTSILEQPLTGPLPVLFAEGGFSVAGLNEWSAMMAQNLPNSTVVRMSTLSEDAGFAQPSCVRSMRADFLRNPSADIDAAACEKESPAIEFVGVG